MSAVTDKRKHLTADAGSDRCSVMGLQLETPKEPQRAEQKPLALVSVQAFTKNTAQGQESAFT